MKLKALAALKDNRTKVIDGFNQLMAKNPSNTAMRPALKAISSSLLDDARRFLEDSQDATYGISIEKTGIHTTILGEFLPDSPIGQTVAQLKNSTQSMLAGLPEDNISSTAASPWIHNLPARSSTKWPRPIRQELTQAGDSAASMLKLLDVYRKVIAVTQAQAFGWLVPTGTLAQGGLFKFINVQTGDSAVLLDAQHSMLDLQGDFTKATNDPSVKLTTVYTANAKQLDGISFNEFKMQMDAARAGTMQARQTPALMKIMYGPDGLVGLTVRVDANHLLTGIGAGDDVLTHAIDTVKAK